MPYGYDMEKHFRLLDSQREEKGSPRPEVVPSGRIYLNATPDDGTQSIRTEPSTRRFLNWLKTRKRDAGPGTRS